MSDMQKFDDDIIKNLFMFSFKDDKQIYTNGAELVSLYRVVQILEHFKVQELVDKATPKKPNLLPTLPAEIIECDYCKFRLKPSDKFCSNCGTEIDWG